MDRFRVFALLAILVSALPFVRILGYDFVMYDDDKNILLDPGMYSGDASSFAHYWQRPMHQMYIPVTYSVWWLEAKVALTRDAGQVKLSPAVFRVVSILLHLAVVLIVYLLLSALTGSLLTSFMGAVFFGVHPLQVESVAWISGQRDLLAGLFSVMSLLLFVKFMQRISAPPMSTRVQEVDGSRNATSASVRQCTRCPWPLFCLALTSLALGLLSKPSAVVVPVLALVLGLWMFPSMRRWTIAFSTCGIGLLIPIAVITHGQQADHGTAIGILDRIVIAGDGIAFYVMKLFLPVGQVIDYGRSPARVLASVFPLAGLVAMICLSGLAVVVDKGRPGRMTLGLVSFFAALLPTSGMVPFGHMDFSTVADRYAYLALLGPALVLAFLPQRTPRLVVAALVVGLFALGTKAFVQTGHWHDSVSLFKRSVEVNPLSRMRNNYATALMGAGRLAEAEENFRAALRLGLGDAGTNTNLGVLLFRTGRFAEAEVHYREALRVNPRYVDGWLNLGLLKYTSKEFGVADSCFRRALELDPSNGPARDYLRVLTVNTSSRGSVKAMVGQGDLTNKANELVQAGDFGTARELYSQVLAVDSMNIAALIGLGNIASLTGDWDAAIARFTRVVKTGSAGQVEAYSNLGTAYFQKKDYQSARRSFEAALRIDSSFQNARLGLADVESVMGSPRRRP